MKRIPLLFLLPPLVAAWTSPAFAQDAGRVAPAGLPLPLPAAAPVPPDQLRAHNPWNLPMTGTWRFQLTHGQIKAGQFQKASAASSVLTASSSESKHPPQDAFDGADDTRWAARGGEFPQWLQADLGATRHVSGVKLLWEYAGDRYECRIEGRVGGGAWQTLADATAAPGIGNGPIPLTPADVRFVRVVVVKNSGAHWASVRDFQILLTENGQEVTWHAPGPDPNENSPAVPDAFAGTNFDDAAWDDQPVPSNWEMAGYSLPTYNDVDNTVGLYRRSVMVPAAWAGKRVYWHFDGALDGAEVFVNGQKAGYHESGYTAFDVDLTGLVKPGQSNLFAVRVSKLTPSYDCDTGDYQSMGGIYRDTSLIAVPETHVDDLTVRTPLAANGQDAMLIAQVHIAGKPGQSVAVTGQLFSADGHPAGVSLSGSARVQPDGTGEVAMSGPVPAPALWSAEKPNLYYLVFSLTSGGELLERVEQRFGFKQVEIQDHIVLWNGKPIKCTGVCRHDFWADKGFALTETNWAEDLRLMKAANINAVRTSHYNHAQRFLELCEEQGMYILDEVPYCWIGDQVKDPAYTPYLLQRARETLARDKNRPCVLAWSLGNENPSGPDSQAVTDLVHTLDPTRPTFVSDLNPADIKGQAWQDSHYPDPAAIDHFAKSTKWGANLSEHPHTFFEREVQAYDPGVSDVWSEALVKTWDKLWKAPNILGSFIWEWQCQGIADKNADTTTDFKYGPDHLRQENNKGIVDAYRHPKPEWWIVKSVYSPVVVGIRTVNPAGGTCTVPVTNHYSFTDLKELTCHWTALKAGTVLKTGTLNIDCGPMQTVQASFPAPAGMTALRLDFDGRDGTSVIASNLAVEGVPLPAAPPPLPAGGALITQDSPDTLLIRNALQQLAFDKHSGMVQSWRVDGHDRLVGGPALNLGEARGKNKGGDDKGIYRADQPPSMDECHLTANLGANGTMQIAVTSTVHAAAGGPELGTLVTTYDLQPDAQMRVNWVLNWSAANAGLWEEGLKFALPAAMTRLSWQREAFFTDYPAGHLGEPAGTARAGEVLFRASKRGLRWLTLTDDGGTGIALLPGDDPVVGRADTAANQTLLFASRELAADYGLTRQWVTDHNVHAIKGKSLAGSFTLRAIGLHGVPPAPPK